MKTLLLLLAAFMSLPTIASEVNLTNCEIQYDEESFTSSSTQGAHSVIIKLTGVRCHRRDQSSRQQQQCLQIPQQQSSNSNYRIKYIYDIAWIRPGERKFYKDTLYICN